MAEGKKTVKSDHPEGYWNERTDHELAEEKTETEIRDALQNEAKRQTKGPRR